MPRYDVTCPVCRYTWEIQRAMDAPNPPCPDCGGMVEQLPSRTAFTVRGYSAKNSYSKTTKA